MRPLPLVALLALLLAPAATACSPATMDGRFTWGLLDRNGTVETIGTGPRQLAWVGCGMGPEADVQLRPDGRHTVVWAQAGIAALHRGETSYWETPGFVLDVEVDEGLLVTLHDPDDTLEGDLVATARPVADEDAGGTVLADLPANATYASLSGSDVTWLEGNKTTLGGRGDTTLVRSSLGAVTRWRLADFGLAGYVPDFSVPVTEFAVLDPDGTMFDGGSDQTGATTVLHLASGNRSELDGGWAIAADGDLLLTAAGSADEVRLLRVGPGGQERLATWQVLDWSDTRSAPVVLVDGVEWRITGPASADHLLVWSFQGQPAAFGGGGQGDSFPGPPLVLWLAGAILVVAVVADELRRKRRRKAN